MAIPAAISAESRFGTLTVSQTFNGGAARQAARCKVGQIVDNTPRRTLASRLEDRDRSRFTGRSGEVAFLNQCLDSTDPPASVVHVCGPGGIGKSTLLREAARRARGLGRSVIGLDAPELAP